MTDLVDCCHCPTPCIIHENDAPILARALDAFAAAAVKAERDACARIASAQSDNYEKHRAEAHAYEIAKAIRARGK